MKIEIETSYIPLKYLINNDIPEYVSVVIPAFTEYRSSENITAFKIIIEFTGAVSASIVAAWLYDKLKNSRSTKMTYKRKEITIDKSEIIKVIEENIEIDKRE